MPLILIGKEFEEGARQGAVGQDLSLLSPVGVLADVAPTILKIMAIRQPDEMTGAALI